MIVIWLTVFALLGAMWVLWDPLGDAFIQILDVMVARFPGYFDANTVQFIRDVDYWFPVFVLLAAVLFVLVQSQRSTVEGYIR